MGAGRDTEAEAQRRMFENMHGQSFGLDDADESQYDTRRAESEHGTQFRERAPTSSGPEVNAPETSRPDRGSLASSDVAHADGDSVSLDADGDEEHESSSKKTRKIGAGGLKVLISIFLSFLLVVSNIFTNGVLSWFGGAVRCRNPTSYGTVLQGIFLVIFYIVATHLIETKVL